MSLILNADIMDKALEVGWRTEGPSALSVYRLRVVDRTLGRIDLTMEYVDRDAGKMRHNVPLCELRKQIWGDAIHLRYMHIPNK